MDDGKSTLIGRLLYDANLAFDTELRAVERDSQRYGTTGSSIDLALLVDGLEAEREQNITIDVGYRYFSTAHRSFIMADTPGHEQFTRNVATAASSSELAIILIDARKGLLSQSRRHAAICSLLGIKHVVLALNKIDLVGYQQAVFDRIVRDFRTYAQRLTFDAIVAIPTSARFGDNIVHRSPSTPWYSGPTLLDHLDQVEVMSDDGNKPLRFHVQWVNRSTSDFRGFSGTIASGVARRGDTIVVASTGISTVISRIVTADGDLDEARAGEAVTLTLLDEIDASRGHLLVGANDGPNIADQFAAHVLSIGTEPILPGRSYLMRLGCLWLPATISMIKHRLDIGDFKQVAARSLRPNEIGFCNLSTSAPVAFDPYVGNRETGSFILVDRYTNLTVAAGLISFPLRRSANIRVERLSVDKASRAAAKRQRGCILWFTGLSGSGKSTIARLVEKKLHTGGCHTYVLDGDNVRHGLNRDLGFTDVDRVENIRRVGEVAKLFLDAGLIILCAVIAPFAAERQALRQLVGREEYIEIFVDAPLDECIRRDPKGLYAKAKRGEIMNFTGFDSPYERPSEPDLVLRTADFSAEQLADRVVEHLRRLQYVA